MELRVGQLVVIAICIFFMMIQVFVKNKQLIHLLFAIFCGSMAMYITHRMLGDSWGILYLLLGLGACATCNGYWLVSRALFREKPSIELPHIIFASVVALLMISLQGISFIETTQLLGESSLKPLKSVLSETMTLFSSSMLVMSFWEGCKGFKQLPYEQRVTRTIFLSAFSISVGCVVLFSGAMPEDWIAQGGKEWLILSASLLMLTVTQLLIWRQHQEARKSERTLATSSLAVEADVEFKQITQMNEEDYKLGCELELRLIQQKYYLQANLKVADLARALSVPEYRISALIRQTFDAKNFNQLINQLRVEYAKSLLSDLQKQHWTVLVISIESGFASVGPFTRAFKQYTGTTPNQFRKQVEEQVTDSLSPSNI